MLIEEGLNPTFNKYPPVDGEPYNEAIVWSLNMTIGMFGPDEGLTTVELTLIPSSDEDDAYWQGFVSLWILTAAFPNWEHKERWLNRTIRAMADGRLNDKLEFQRDGRKVETGKFNAYWFLGISGVQPSD